MASNRKPSRGSTVLASLVFAQVAVTASPSPVAAKSEPRSSGRAERTAPAANAAVDPSGRIVPIVSPGNGIEVIGNASPTSVRIGAEPLPCPDAKPLAQDEARSLVAAIATEEGFYPDFVASVAKVESGYVSTALSDKGAYGLMQLMPATAKAYGVDLCKPAENVRGGVRLLRALHAKYRNPFFILSAYNAGEVAVRQARGVPPVPETMRFVASVMNEFYDWPAPAPERMSAGRSSKPRASEPASATFEARETSAPSPTPSPWSEGFVMHVE
jgi:Transglycosylase SLT domain